MMRLLLLIWLFLIFDVAPARAQDVDYNWLVPVSGSFQNPAIWTPFNPVPPPPFFFGPGGETDRAHFDLGVLPANRYTVTEVEGVNEQLIIEDDSLTLEIVDYETVRVDTLEFSSVVVGHSSGDDADVILTGSPGSELRAVNVYVGVGLFSSGTATVDGTGFNWTNSGFIEIGHEGNGILNIQNGGNVSNTVALIAHLSSSDSSVTVDGAGSTWSNSGCLFVGYEGNGILNIQNGGAVSNTTGVIAHCSPSVSSATVDGAGSTWSNFGFLEVGHEGNGILNIQNGGTVSNTFGRIAHLSSSVSSATVDGAGSSWTSSDGLTVGSSGTGTLNIIDGGAVSNDAGVIGDDVGSSGDATVDGAGSTWTNMDFLTVGENGDGLLTVQNGGLISSSGGIIGSFSTGSGDAIVDGSGSAWTMSGNLSVGANGSGSLCVEHDGFISSLDLTVGFNANGTLDIQHGGFIGSLDDAIIGRFPASSGTVNIAHFDSIWDVAGQLSIGGYADTGENGGTGTLTINGGTVSVAENTYLFPDGTLNLNSGTFSTDAVSFDGGGEFDFNGGTLHVGTFNGDLINEGGILAPGESPGSTTVVGAYTQQEDAALEIEIGGPLVNSEFDFVNVTGNVFVDGELDLVLINGFLPTNEQTFTILNSNGLFGFFINVTDNQRLDTVNGMGSFLVRYGVTSPNPNQIILSEFEPDFLLGDVNGDGEVNLLDVGPFIDLLTNGEFNAAADINMDGEVNLLDVGPFVALLAG